MVTLDFGMSMAALLIFAFLEGPDLWNRAERLTNRETDMREASCLNKNPWKSAQKPQCLIFQKESFLFFYMPTVVYIGGFINYI